MIKLGEGGGKFLKIIHLLFVSVWFGGVVTWFPLVFGNELTDPEATLITYRNMRDIAWNVIGWGGIGSFFTGFLNGLLTNWGLFKYKWVTVKFFTVIGLILFGMFFLENMMLMNLDILEQSHTSEIFSGKFLFNHKLIKAGLILEMLAFLIIIVISVVKPWGRFSDT